MQRCRGRSRCERLPWRLGLEQALTYWGGASVATAATKSAPATWGTAATAKGTASKIAGGTDHGVGRRLGRARVLPRPSLAASRPAIGCWEVARPVDVVGQRRLAQHPDLEPEASALGTMPGEGPRTVREAESRAGWELDDVRAVVATVGDERDPFETHQSRKVVRERQVGVGHDDAMDAHGGKLRDAGVHRAVQAEPWLPQDDRVVASRPFGHLWIVADHGDR